MFRSIALAARRPASGAVLTLTGLLAYAAFSLTVFGEEPSSRGPRLLGGLAADFDTDQDGTISRQEFDQGADVIFGELDQNGDGVLSDDELPRFRGPRYGHGPGRGRGPGRERFASMIVARTADEDRDGEVTANEWQGFLDALEINSDGSISEESLLALLPQLPAHEGRPAREPRSGHLSRILDQDGDSVLETDDLNATFRELDQDGDGALQAEELPRFGGRHRHSRH